ncbi:Gfo/Idh/MocA family protein [Patescibacteria group bacterium]
MIKVGVIGTTFGRDVATCFNSFRQSKVVALGGRDPQKTETIASELGVEKPYSNWKELIDNSEIDLVAIATPNFLHREMFDYAVSKNKHILIEKPGDIKPEGIKKMAESVKNYKKFAFVNHATRFHPVVQYMKKLIKNKSLGYVSAIRITAYSNWFSDPTTKYFWTHDKSLGGGYTMVFGVHLFDLGRYLLNQKPLSGSIIKSVIPDEIIRPQPTSEAQITAQYKFDKGAILQLFANAYTQGYKNLEIQVFGNKGILLYDDINGLQISKSNKQSLKKVHIKDRLDYIQTGRSLLTKSLKYLVEGYLKLLNGNKVEMDKFCTLETACENLKCLFWE